MMKPTPRTTDTTRAAKRRCPTGNVLTGAVLAGSLAMGAPGTTLAQATPGYYVGLHAGANDLNRWPATVGFGAGVSAQGALDLGAGAQFGVAIGRRTENARFEIEYQRGRFRLEGTELGPVTETASGSGRYETVLFNADRVFALAGATTAYAGVGVGWGSVRFPAAGSAACRCFGSATGDGLAYQGRIGIEHSLAGGPSLFAQAAWISLPGASAGGTPGVDYPRRATATLNVGLRLRF